MSTSPLAIDALVVNNVIGNSFLDVGCGHGKWGFLLKEVPMVHERSSHRDRHRSLRASHPLAREASDL